MGFVGTIERYLPVTAVVTLTQNRSEPLGQLPPTRASGSPPPGPSVSSRSGCSDDGLVRVRLHLAERERWLGGAAHRPTEWSQESFQP